MAQCKAQSKQSGERCKRHVTPGREVCRIHGGKSLAGIASPQLKTGRYSKHLPERLLERYQAAQDDPDLLVLREEVALIDARLLDLLGRVDTGESGELWNKAQQLLTDYRSTDDTIEQNNLLMELEATISDGVSDYSAWGEVYRAVTQRQKLVESERKRLVELRQTLTAEQGMVLIANISNIIRTHVTDRATLAAIAADIAGLAHHQPRGVLDIGGNR